MAIHLLILIGILVPEGTSISIFKAGETWGAVSIAWGDGTVNTIDPNWEANEIITHTYSTAVDTFVVTIAQTTGSCVL